jgi:uncharacterized alpha/beta hydrolase family protein
MKKRIFGLAIVAAIALVSGWNISQSKSEVAMSDMALANVEALADTEITYPGGGPIYCCGSTGYCTSIGGVVINGTFRVGC